MDKSENVEAHELLRKTGLEEVEAIRLNEIIGRMASENLIARLDAQTEIMKTEMKARNIRFTLLIIVLAIVGAALTIAVAVD